LSCYSEVTIQRGLVILQEVCNCLEGLGSILCNDYLVNFTWFCYSEVVIETGPLELQEVCDCLKDLNLFLCYNYLVLDSEKLYFVWLF
jgi:hypothetical protein